MKPDDLLNKAEQILNEWHNCQIKKKEAKERLVKLIKEYYEKEIKQPTLF